MDDFVGGEGACDDPDEPFWSRWAIAVIAIALIGLVLH